MNPIGGGALPDWLNAGAFQMQDNAAGSAFGTFIAWCLDISHWLGGTGRDYPYESTLTPFANSYGLDSLQMERVQRFFDANYALGLETNVNQSAAFQMGLWEVLYDDDFSLVADTAATDDFRGVAGNASSVTAFTLAGTYLSAAQTYSGGQNWSLIFLESQNYRSPHQNPRYRQNLVTAVQYSGTTPVPVPAAGLLMVFGLAGLGLMTRRRRASAAA